MGTTLNVNFKGLLNETHLPEYKALWPLFETIINSIQSISDCNENHNGEIYIKANRLTQITTDDQSALPYVDFEITDNGAGFNSNNYNSFREAYSSLKISKGCKGLGRFLWLKAFDRVEITSIFIEDNKKYKRSFTFNTESFINPENNLENANETDAIHTTVKLIGFKNKYQKNCPSTVEPIAKKIIEHCMVYFVTNQCPKITIEDDSNLLILNDYFEERIKDTLHQDSFTINNHDFKIFHLQMFDNASRHEMHLCASEREVESIALSKYEPNLGVRLIDENNKSYYYSGFITSHYLDENVNSNRTEFLISDDKSLFNDTTKNEIVKSAIEFALLYLKEDIQRLIDEKKKEIDRFVSEKRPQYRFLLHSMPEVYNEIPSGCSDDKLELELHKQSQKWEHELLKQKKDIETSIREKTISVGDFDKIFETYCKGINDLSKSSLTEYVIRRKAILHLLKEAITLDENDKYRKENLLHTIICPMSHTSDDMPFDELNLWVIDERLAYHHFLASDKKMKNLPVIDSNSNSRMDIAVFNKPLSFSAEDRNFNSISIIELKRPGRDNYDDDENPIDQVLNYVKEIRDGNAKKANGLGFGKVDNTQFYCYIIADLTDSLKQKAENSGFTPSPDGEGYFCYNSVRRAYIEIISYSKLVNDAELSNQILFDKLLSPKSSEIVSLFSNDKLTT